MPNKLPKPPVPKATYDPGSGGSYMDIQPLDPRQGQPLDQTVPHALDQTLAPPLKPGQGSTPVIGPPSGSPSDWKADPLILNPADWKRPGYTGTTKT